METQRDSTAGGEWALDDTIFQLREWGRDHAYVLPQSPFGEWTVGAAASCEIRLLDGPQYISRKHVRLRRAGDVWTMQDLNSKNGLWLDGARRLSFELAPGVEVGIGSLHLVAESPRLFALRAFLLRLLGWSEAQKPAIDHALRSIRSAATLRAPLVICGRDGLVSIARYIHDRAFGEELPFVVSDPHRERSSATVRSPANYTTSVEALEAARGGTLCVWSGRLPDDFAEARAHMSDSGVRVRLIMCSTERSPQPETVIRVPSLHERTGELERIIDECAEESFTTHGAPNSEFPAEDREWIQERQPRSYVEVAQSVERLIAVRVLGSVTKAAAHLGMSHVAMTRWLDRRAARRRRNRRAHED